MSLVKLNVKKGDTVVVLSGKDKGKQGKVVTAMPKKGKVIVEGVAGRAAMTMSASGRTSASWSSR